MYICLIGVIKADFSKILSKFLDTHYTLNNPLNNHPQSNPSNAQSNPSNTGNPGNTGKNVTVGSDIKLINIYQNYVNNLPPEK